MTDIDDDDISDIDIDSILNDEDVRVEQSQ